MSKAEILEYFDDINVAYNNSGKHDSLKSMLDEFEQEIRNKAIDEFASKLHEKCDSVIKIKWNDETAPTSWSHAYADFKDDIDDITEQMKGN